MSEILDTLHEVLGTHKIRQHEPLDQHTLWKKGGRAELYVEIDKVDELIRLIQKAKEIEVPIFLLGSGSLIPTSDHDIKGLVIKNLCRRFDKMSMKGKINGGQREIEKVLVSAEAGVLMNQLVRFTIEEGLEGLEYQLGLPGTVGGAIHTNAEFKGHFVRDSLVSLRVIDKKGEVQTHMPKFSFLSKRQDKWREANTIILSAIFELVPQHKNILWERGQEAVEYRNKKTLNTNI